MEYIHKRKAEDSRQKLLRFAINLSEVILRHLTPIFLVVTRLRLAVHALRLLASVVLTVFRSARTR